MKHPLYTLLLLPIPLILLFLAHTFHVSPDSSEPPSLQPILADFGIETPQSRTFSSETLADYINGAADAYIEAGFVLCTVCEGSEGENEMILERYEMSSEEAAASILALEGGEFVSEEAFAFVCLHYYFKATIFSDDETLSEKVRETVMREACQ